VCDASVPPDQARRLTPRELAGMAAAHGDTRAQGLRERAVSIVLHNNPPNAADRPMWWVCEQCLGTVLTVGDSTLVFERAKSIDAGLGRPAKSAPEQPPPERPAPAEPAPEKPKKKWSFWK